jgi:hypothetical protein
MNVEIKLSQKYYANERKRFSTYAILKKKKEEK